MRDSLKKTILDIILRMCAFAPLVLFIPTYHLLFGTVGPGGVYQTIIQVFLSINCFLILISALWIVFGRAKSKVLRWSMGIIATLTIICLLVLAHGMWQDVNGVRCDGFFGASARCVDMAGLQLTILFFYPLSFVGFASAILVSLSTGLWKEYKYVKTRPQNHPRK